MLPQYPGVDGHLRPHDDGDIPLLRQHTQSTREVPGDVLEVGSYHGLSGLVIMSEMPPWKTFWSVDPNEDYGLIATENWIKFAPPAIVRVSHRSRIEDFALPPDALISLAFIDGDHTAASTACGMEFVWPHLSPGGILMVHDNGHADYPGVHDAIVQWLIAHAPEAEVLDPGFLWAARKRV
jgi:predicted O-methyltransferase YrrM